MLASWCLRTGRLWQIGEEPQARAAGTFVIQHAGSNRVGTVTADEATVLVGDHRSELRSHHAVTAANNQCRVSCRASRSHIQVFSTLMSEAKQRKAGQTRNSVSRDGRVEPTVRQACRLIGRSAVGGQDSSQNENACDYSEGRSPRI